MARDSVRRSWTSEDFTAFNDFYGRVLENGVLFEEELGIKLVGFHPAFVHSPLYLGLQILEYPVMPKDMLSIHVEDTTNMTRLFQASSRDSVSFISLCSLVC